MIRHVSFPLLSLVLWCAGCTPQATYIETGGAQSIVSVGEVDIQDIQRAASDMLDSMLASGVLSTALHQPPGVVVEQVINDTSSRFDVGELVYRMRSQLVNSGAAQIEGAYGLNAESAVAREEIVRRAARSGRPVDEVVQPDFSLRGRITQLKRRAGSVRQTTYTFRLTLFDLNTGREAWTDYVEITKQGTKPSVGF